MESRLHSVPLSAAQMAPKATPSISGIRAPLTVDESDFEYSFSSKIRKNSTTSSYYSGSELESEGGFASGEDEFESASERTYVTDPDEEVLEKTHLVKEYAFSRPFVKIPNEKSVLESINSLENGFSRPFAKSLDEGMLEKANFVEDNAFSRPFVKNPNGEIVEESNNSLQNGFLRPFVKSPDEEFPRISGSVGGNAIFRPSVLERSDSRPIVAVTDEEVSENEPTPVTDIKLSPIQKFNVPIAKISWDSDDDSLGSDVSEDAGFSVIARIPSIEVLQRFNIPPKVRISEVDDVDDNESEGENVAEMEFVQDLVIGNGLKDEKDRIVLDDTISKVDEVDGNESKGENVADMEFVEDLVVSNGLKDEKDRIVLDDTISKVDEVDGNESEGENVADMEFVEDLVVSNGLKDEKDSIGLDDPIPRVISADMIQDKEVGANSLVENEECNSVSEPEQNGDQMLFNETNQEIDVITEPEVTELDSSSDFGGVSVDDGAHKSIGIVREDNLDFNHDIESEKVEIEQEPKNGADSSEQLCGETEHCSVHTDDTKEMVAEMEQEQDSIKEHSEDIDSQIITNSNEGGVSDHGQKIDSAELAAFSEEDNEEAVESASLDDIEIFSIKEDLADVGSVESKSPVLFASPTTNIELDEALSEVEKENLEKIQQLRIKYLRLLHRLGCSQEDSIAAKVLHQMTNAEVPYSSQASNLDSAKNAAMELESLEAKIDLDCSLSILVIGKTGVGKSATINSLFGEKKSAINAFEPTTNKIKEIIGTIDGVKIKIFDTPGLRTSITDQSINRRVLSSIKKLIQKSPPDIILYFDRLDTETNDSHTLKLVTSYLGSSIWRKSVLVLTHATSLPPDGPDGHPLSHDVFVAQQSRAFQQLISPGSIVPVALAENHPFAKSNGNVGRWRSNLLFLCCSIKILSEVSCMVRIRNCETYMEGILDQETENPENFIIRHNFLEPSLQIIARPFFYSRDCGYDGVVVEDKIDLSGHFPAVISVLAKDKKEFSLQFSVGRNYTLNVRAGLNNKLSGGISVKTSCTDQLQIAATVLLPIAEALFKKIFAQSNEN